MDTSVDIPLYQYAWKIANIEWYVFSKGIPEYLNGTQDCSINSKTKKQAEETIRFSTYYRR